jgi:hypoxanthine phosphoribosyltransferase
MAELIPILSEDDIRDIVKSLAGKISSDYQGSEVVLVSILKGSFIFLADLARKLTIPVTIEFIGASSYGGDTVSSGDLQFTTPLNIDITDKHVLIVEDIVDTGLTLNKIVAQLHSMHPKSVKVCTFIDKKERRATRVSIDYSGHVIEKGFLVGFGLDYAEKHRNLPGIFQLNL